MKTTDCADSTDTEDLAEMGLFLQRVKGALPAID
jgi:hypothetical protein